MFYIVKGHEPNSLIKYKKEPYAYYDGYKNKNDVRENLLKEQGYLCAYCMRRIESVEDVTIEHYIPQSELKVLGDRAALDYRIMLGVCKRNRNCEKKYQTCDAHRNNEPLTVNPWNENSISLIQYQQGTGIIYSDNSEINKDLNDTLNLNCTESRLPENRKAALDSLKEFLIKKKSSGTWSSSMLENIEKIYADKDGEGKYKEYVGILLWYIRQRIN